MPCMNYPNGDTEGEEVATDGGQTIPTDSGSVSDSLPIKTGAVMGAVAYVATFIVTYVLALVESGGDLLDSNSFESYEVAGWFMYNAQNVDIGVSSGGQSTTENLLEVAYAGADTTIPKITFYIVPVVVLFFAGRQIADAAGTVDPVAGAKVGATAALGYTGLAIVGAFTIFSVTQSGFGSSVTYEPELTGTLLFFAGYAVVVAGAGGYVASQ